MLNLKKTFRFLFNFPSWFKFHFNFKLCILFQTSFQQDPFQPVSPTRAGIVINHAPIHVYPFINPLFPSFINWPINQSISQSINYQSCIVQMSLQFHNFGDSLFSLSLPFKVKPPGTPMSSKIPSYVYYKCKYVPKCRPYCLDSNFVSNTWVHSPYSILREQRKWSQTIFMLNNKANSLRL